MDAEAPPPPIGELTAAHESAATEAANASQAAYAAQRAGIEALQQALADGNSADAEAAVDDMWDALYRSFSATRELAGTWNALVPWVGRQ